MTRSTPPGKTPSDSTRPLTAAAGRNDSPVPRLSSKDLFRQMREVEIEHEGRIYTLRLTQFNKLILTA